MAVSFATTFIRTRDRLDWRQGGIVAFLLALLVSFILYPIVRVLWISLSDDAGNLTLLHFLNFFRRPLFRESLWNTLQGGFFVVFFSAVMALPLAYIIARYEFRGKVLLQTAATLPLVIPPFVGAVALQLILGRSGMVNLLLMDWFDITIRYIFFLSFFSTPLYPCPPSTLRWKKRQRILAVTVSGFCAASHFPSCFPGSSPVLC
jgi:ABC-type Fe3+ transport system permease subunit